LAQDRAGFYCIPSPSASLKPLKCSANPIPAACKYDPLFNENYDDEAQAVLAVAQPLNFDDEDAFGS
jgi:hypothetical protein